MSIFIDKHELAEKQDIVNPNIFTGSKDFTGNWLNVEQVKQKDKYLDFTAVYVDWAWNGITQYIDVKKDEVLTVSAYVKANAGSTITLFSPLNSDNESGHTRAGTDPQGSAITPTGDWQKVSYCFRVLGNGTIKPRVESDGTVPFWVAGMKLERGGNATPWCPAYDDYVMQSDLDNLKEQIEQLKSK